MTPEPQRPRIEAPARTAYLVLGMHRSGTSAVTQLLALAGADLPKNVMPGDEHNERGYFEPWKIAILNDERLWAGGGAWDNIFAFPHRALPRKEERRWLNRAAAVLEEEYGDAPFPVLKDPRVTVLLPFWRMALADLEIGVRSVISVRHPLAVAGSLQARNGFAVEKSVLLWCAYMLAAEAYTRDLPRAFVGYDALLNDWRGEAARIERAHGAPLPRLDANAAEAIDQFLTPELRHNSDAGELEGLGWVGRLAAQLLDWLQRAASDQTPQNDGLKAVTAEMGRRQAEIGALVSPAARELDMLRSEFRESRHRLAAEVAELKARMADDRETLEAGWRTDVEGLVRAQAEERAVLEAGWKADVRRLTSQQRKLEVELERLRQAWAELGIRLDAILAED